MLQVLSFVNEMWHEPSAYVRLSVVVVVVTGRALHDYYYDFIEFLLYMQRVARVYTMNGAHGANC